MKGPRQCDTSGTLFYSAFASIARRSRARKECSSAWVLALVTTDRFMLAHRRSAPMVIMTITLTLARRTAITAPNGL